MSCCRIHVAQPGQVEHKLQPAHNQPQDAFCISGLGSAACCICSVHTALLQGPQPSSSQHDLDCCSISACCSNS